MAFPKITYLDKVLSLQVPREQNMVTVDNINEIKHVVNALSDGLDIVSGVIDGLSGIQGGIQEIYYINDSDFPSAGINSGLYINNQGQAKYYINDEYIDLSLPVATDMLDPTNINNVYVPTTQAVSAYVEANKGNIYKEGNMIEITDDNTINVVLPKNNLEISGRYLICHRDLNA